MHRLLMIIMLSLAAFPAQAQQQKQYCTPEAAPGEQLEKSMKVCDAMIADPRQPVKEKIQAYQNRGELYLRKREYSSSLQNFNQAIALVGTLKVVPFTGFGGPPPPPGSIDDIKASSVYSGRAQLFERQKEHSRAIEDYTKSLQIHQSRDTLYRRAKSYEALGQYDRAIADIDQSIAVIASDPYPRDYGARAELYLKKGDHDRAIRDFDKTLELNAKTNQAHGDKDILAGRGAAYLAKGDVDRALQDLDKAIVGNDNVSRYRNYRGLVYRKKGDLERALEEFEQAVRNDFLSGQSRRDEYLFNRAEAYGEKGEWLKALEDYQSVLTINSSFSKATSGRDAARLALSRQSIATIVPANVNPVAPVAGPPERRVALIIGNSAYQSVPALPNPKRDADTLARALRGANFQVVQIATDLPRDKLAQALQTFAAEADNADWAMVYFAGHGIEIGGVNYLIPIDAKLKVDRDVPFEAVALDQVLTSVTGAKKLRLVVLDACRDNPFVAKMARTVAGRSIGRGLASIEPEGGTLVAFAAKHGQTALDGQSGGNSPFVAAFVKHLQSPGLEISKIFRLVRDDVLAATGKQQEPFTYGSLPGQDFFFRLQ